VDDRHRDRRRRRDDGLVNPTDAGTESDETVLHRSFCRFCEAACAVLVETRGADVVRVRGDADSPLSRGYTCPKGRSLPAWHHHPDRLDLPHLRDPDGELRAAPWTEVLDDLADRLRSLIDEYGPDSVGVLLATGSAFDSIGRRTAQRMWQQMGSRSLYTSGSIDTPCKPFVARLMSGFPGLVPALDHDRAGLTILIGVNPVVSHGHLNAFPDPVVTLRALADHGRELWVLDPRVSESARLATEHLAPRPGTDHLVLAHVVREVLRDGADRAYMDQHVDPADVDVLHRTVEPWDARATAHRCDVPVAALERLVAAVRRHGRVAVQTGTGTTMARSANVTEWMSWSLQIVTGSFDRPGGSWFNPGFLRRLETRSLAPAGAEPGPGPSSRPELRNWLNEFPCSAMVDEIDAGNLRALVVFGGNPTRALPEPDRVAEALGRLEAFAVVDVVETDSSRLASHVLPATGQLERADLPLEIDQFVPTLSTQYTPAVVAPGAERRPAWWMFAQLAERLGLQVLPDGLHADAATEDDLLRPLVERSRGDWDDLVERRWALDEPIYGWVLDRVLPEGRWRLAPPLLVEQFEGLVASPVPVLQLIPRRQPRHLNSQFADDRAAVRQDRPDILISPADAQECGVRDGDRVRVRSRHGEVFGTASVVDEIRPGAVSVPHGFGAPNVTVLTSATADIDPHTAMVLQCGVDVTVEPMA
jgi:anaerobic selenocysteine-containing dehydrogenase